MNALSVLSNDRPDSVKPETRSIPNGLRREKGIEDVRLYLIRKPTLCVCCVRRMM